MPASEALSVSQEDLGRGKGLWGGAVWLTLPGSEVWQQTQERSGPWGPDLQINVGERIRISTLNFQITQESIYRDRKEKIVRDGEI